MNCFICRTIFNICNPAFMAYSQNSVMRFNCFLKCTFVDNNAHDEYLDNFNYFQSLIIF